MTDLITYVRLLGPDIIVDVFESPRSKRDLAGYRDYTWIALTTLFAVRSMLPV